VQAELFRRIAQGRLAEILGPGYYLELDITYRTRGYSEQELQAGFDALDTEVKSIINGYVAGFNRHIAEIRDNPLLLPIEFTLIGLLQGSRFIPEDWTPLDVLAFGAQLQRDFDAYAMDVEQIDWAGYYNELMEKFPNDFQDMLDDLRWSNDPDAITYIDKIETTESASMGVLEKQSGEETIQDIPDLRQAAKNMKKIHNSVVKD
jgi:penicillin amidase